MVRFESDSYLFVVPCRKACKKCENSRPCFRCISRGLESQCVNSERKRRTKGTQRGPYKRLTEHPAHQLAKKPQTHSALKMREISPQPQQSNNNGFPSINLSILKEAIDLDYKVSQDKGIQLRMAKAVAGQNLFPGRCTTMPGAEPLTSPLPPQQVQSSNTLVPPPASGSPNGENQNGLDTLLYLCQILEKNSIPSPYLKTI